MANEKHLAILRQGVSVWNEWRRNHVKPADFSGADLQGLDLTGISLGGVMIKISEQDANLVRRTLLHDVNLKGATLARADLYAVDARRANLVAANLVNANLRDADLSNTKLHRARLDRASLADANLSNAIFDYADLSHTLFDTTDLNGADFTKAVLSNTIFVNMDLRGVQGLDRVYHFGPSTIGIDTLYKSHGQIPEVFLRGCGVPDSMIEYARSLVAAERPIDYYSCFISHSSRDEMLAERLYADLQARGVRCWYAPHDIQIGESILSGIDRGIRLHDKLLLILSESSVESGWVEQEVHMALAREKTERRRVLFPIRIDDAVLDSRQGWPAILRDTIHIGDFRQWNQHDAYQSAFARLLRDLKAEQA